MRRSEPFLHTALATLGVDTFSGMDHLDSQLMGAHVNLAAGRLIDARAHADAFAALPFLREVPHVALARRIEVDAMAGELGELPRLSESFLDGWLRSGRPTANSLASAPHAAAMAYGMAGDSLRRAELVAVARALLREPDTLGDPALVWPAVHDALLALHFGDAETALRTLAIEPDAMPHRATWQQSVWLPWYAAAWAEASGILQLPDVERRLHQAYRVATGNDVALAVIERTAALRRDEQEVLPFLAARMAACGCTYQAHRTTEIISS